jgi:hypothetical protein
MTRQFRLFLWFLFGVGLSALSMFSFAADGDIAAQWPSPSEYPTCSRTESFACTATCSGGSNKFNFIQTSKSGPTGGSLSVPHGVKYYGFNGGGTETGCFVAPDKPYCPPSYSWDGADSCVPANPCSDRSGKYFNNGNGMESTANLVGGDGAFSGDTTGSKMPDTFCLKGCLASTENLDGGAAGTSWYGYGNPKFSGQKCSTGGTAPQTEATAKAPPSPEYDCAKAGKGFGYVSGVVMCVPINKTQENTTKTDTSNKPDGTKTQVKTDTAVKCDGVTCTTTTTTTTIEFNSSGTQVGTSTGTNSTSKPDPSASGASGTGTKGDSSFCAENPSSAMCKQGAFMGNCASGFTCEGDPAACASAKALQEQKCEQSKAAESLASHADENLIQFDQVKADAALNKDGAKDLKLNEIWESKKQTYLNFAKGCPVSERTFTVMGTTYTFDLSIVCTIGEFVSVLMHLAAYMFALRLFQRTVF